MYLIEGKDFVDVHCRIGSLETMRIQFFQFLWVHCRIGSLEM